MPASPSHLTQTIKPIFYFSRIFGLVPFSLDSLSISPGSILYSTMLIVVLMYSEINKFKKIFGFDLLPKIGKILVVFEQIHFTANMFVSWAVVIFRYEKLIVAIQGFTAVENLFKRLDVDVPHKSHVVYQILQIIVVSIIIVVMVTLDFILNGLRNGFIIGSTVNIIVIMQYLDFVLLYRLYFSLLNKQISMFGAKTSGKIKLDFGVNSVSDMNCMVSVGFPPNTDVHSLKVIRETHRFLYCLHSDFSSFYSLQLLFSVSSSILTIIAALYYYALYTISGLDLYYQHYWIGTLNSGFTALYNFIKLLIIVHVCTTTTDEVSNTSVLVHSLMNDETTSTGLQTELQMFSNQLMHQKVVFTACGFFNLDFTLISAVIGAVSTYMVILIQFQITS